MSWRFSPYFFLFTFISSIYFWGIRFVFIHESHVTMQWNAFNKILKNVVRKYERKGQTRHFIYSSVEKTLTDNFYSHFPAFNVLFLLSLTLQIGFPFSIQFQCLTLNNFVLDMLRSFVCVSKSVINVIDYSAVNDKIDMPKTEYWIDR